MWPVYHNINLDIGSSLPPVGSWSGRSARPAPGWCAQILLPRRNRYGDDTVSFDTVAGGSVWLSPVTEVGQHDRRSGEEWDHSAEPVGGGFAIWAKVDYYGIGSAKGRLRKHVLVKIFLKKNLYSRKGFGSINERYSSITISEHKKIIWIGAEHKLARFQNWNCDRLVNTIPYMGSFLNSLTVKISSLIIQLSTASKSELKDEKSDITKQ